LFGRGEECELRTEDPLVSRQHARIIVSAAAVMVEDLGSRNGVMINGVKISQVQVVKPDDRIRIGNQDLTVLKGCDTWNEAPATTQRFDGWAIIAELSEKAMALGRIDEAERLVEGPFVQLLEDLSSGRDVPAALVVKATKLGARLADFTSKRVWVERLIQLYSLLKRPWPADAIDAMYETARRVSGLNRALLKAYVNELQQLQLGPADRFLVRRIEGLERQFPIP
jgi:hypothetical protein